MLYCRHPVLRIRTFLVGSGRLGPDPDPGLNKLPYLNFFNMFKSQKYFKHLCCLTFWFMKILFRAHFHRKNFQKKVSRKFIRVRIRIRTFSKVGSGSGQKSSGSATLLTPISGTVWKANILTNFDD
jgi:hypothetical protein